MYMCVYFKIILSYFIIIYLNPYFILILKKLAINVSNNII